MARLGVVTTSYPREPGDPAGAFVGGLARWLAGQGHEIEVIAAGPGMARDGDVRIERISTGAALFYDEGAPDRLERRPTAWLDAPRFSAALAARVATRAPRWQGVISHWLAPSGLATALGTVGRGMPHLAVAHSGDVHLLSRPGLADLAVAAILAGKSHVVFVAEHLRERLAASLLSPGLRRALMARSSISPMGIEPPRPMDRTLARRLLGAARRRGDRRISRPDGADQRARCLDRGQPGTTMDRCRRRRGSSAAARRAGQCQAARRSARRAPRCALFGRGSPRFSVATAGKWPRRGRPDRHPGGLVGRVAGDRV